MALEQIREQEEQLKQIMIYTGRPGLWHDWQRFQAKARVARKEAEEAARRKRKQIIEISIITFLLIVGLGYSCLLCTADTTRTRTTIMALAKSQQSLKSWTKQKWRTKSGKPSAKTGERYLPEKAIKSLTPAEYAATTRAKREGTRKGKQFVRQPKSIAKKTARFRRGG